MRWCVYHTLNLRANKLSQHEGPSPRPAQHSTHAAQPCCTKRACTAKIGSAATRTRLPCPLQPAHSPSLAGPAPNRARSSPWRHGSPAAAHGCRTRRAEGLAAQPAPGGQPAVRGRPHAAGKGGGRQDDRGGGARQGRSCPQAPRRTLPPLAAAAAAIVALASLIHLSAGCHLFAPEQMRSSSKKPSDYLNELPPLPETRFKVRSSHAPARRHSALPLHLLGPCSACA